MFIQLSEFSWCAPKHKHGGALVAQSVEQAPHVHWTCPVLSLCPISSSSSAVSSKSKGAKAPPQISLKINKRKHETLLDVCSYSTCPQGSWRLRVFPSLKAPSSPSYTLSQSIRFSSSWSAPPVKGLKCFIITFDIHTWSEINNQMSLWSQDISK